MRDSSATFLYPQLNANKPKNIDTNKKKLRFIESCCKEPRGAFSNDKNNPKTKHCIKLKLTNEKCIKKISTKGCCKHQHDISQTVNVGIWEK